MAGPEEQTELFPSEPSSVPWDTESGYFDGHRLEDVSITSRLEYGLESGSLHRHSFLYKVEYPVSGGGPDESETGVIELRGRTWAYTASLPDDYRGAVEATAQKAAVLFNSSRETGQYEGYLDGFFKGSFVPRVSTRWESEEVGASDPEASPGKVTWSVEVYDEDGNLSGVADGLAHPWRVESERVPGEEAEHIAPHKWRITFNDSRGDYQLAATGRSRARDRYKAGGPANDKLVYVNGQPVGRLDEEGRTWLSPGYGPDGEGHTASGAWGTYWSREGLVDETTATYQALRRGGVLYLTGETSHAIHLATSAALPPGYEPVDPDDVSDRQRAREGRDPYTRRVLFLAAPDDGVTIECRRDERVIRHLGYSIPRYRHAVARRWSP